jgi:hypothetical protein
VHNVVRDLRRYVLFAVVLFGAVLTVHWGFTSKLRSRRSEGPTSSGHPYTPHRGVVDSRNLSVERIASTVAAPPSVEERTAVELGRFPALALTTAIGLLFVALAYLAGHTETTGAVHLFWVGILTVFVPCAARIISSQSTRTERILLLVLLGLGLYLVKIFHSPVGFTFYDEFSNWRSVNDIVKSQQLFNTNPLHRVSHLYPGLPAVVTGTMNISGLGIFPSGIIVIGIARVTLILATYLVFEQLTSTSRTAGIATLVFMANPTFVFFNAQVAYESLGWPIAAITMFAAVKHVQRPKDPLRLVVAVVGVAALTVTHHLTSYALVALLLLWTGVHVIHKRTLRDGPALIALLGVISILLWFLVSSSVIEYVRLPIGRAANELTQVLSGEVPSRQLFRDYAGHMPPFWERAIAYAGAGVVLLGIPIGLWRIWKRYRSNTLLVALATVALAYPLPLGLRFLVYGNEIGNRTTGHMFFAVSLVFAIAVITAARVLPSAARLVFITGIIAVVFVSGVSTGWAHWSRLSGPYLVAADTRSVESQSIQVAVWARDELGAGNRFATDRTNRQRLASQGEQDPVSFTAGDTVDTSSVFFSREFGPIEIEALRVGGIEYLVVDRRLASGLPMVGFYFEPGEDNAYRHQTPVAPDALAKFDGVQGVNRIFETKDIVVYDVRAVTNEAP